MASHEADTEAKTVLRDLAKELKEKPNELRDFGNGKIARFLATQDRNLVKVDRSGSLAFDAKIFRDAAGLAHEQVKALAGDEQRTLPKLLLALKKKYARGAAYDIAGAMDPKAFDWTQFSRDVGYLFRPGVGVSCLFGPLDVQQKARARTAARQKKIEAPLERPEELTTAGGSKQETDKLIDVMFKALHRQGNEGCPVVKLVLNRQSFAQTAENIFTLSFLVRDGRASPWMHPETKMMMVRVIETTKKGAAAAAAGPSNAAPAATGEQLQFIIELTMDDWGILSREITDTLMPHRDEVEEQPTQTQRHTAGKSGQKRRRD